MTRFVPETIEQLRDAVAWAVSEEAPVDVKGTGTKVNLGRPVNLEHEIALGGLTGIKLYEADELILQAAAGTKLSEIEAVLAESNQQLAFEPMDLGPLLHGVSEKGSLGGAIAANLSGPRRIKAGAARDHMLGFAAVSGRGEIFKSGGRVMKNVTGYDLCKLMCGSWGTLAIMSEITVKVLPRAEKQRTVLIACDTVAEAVNAMSQGLNSPYDISAAAWMPGDIAALSSVEHVAGLGSGVIALRMEGPGPSVEYRCAELIRLLGGFGPVEELHSHNSDAFWATVRDVIPFAGEGDARAVWRVSVAPSDAVSLYQHIQNLQGAQAFLDWGGGLVWVALDPALHQDGAAVALRAAVAETGGHATLIRGASALRGGVDVFQPQNIVSRGLSERIKLGFDPGRILNPGRMYDGI